MTSHDSATAHIVAPSGNPATDWPIKGPETTALQGSPLFPKGAEGEQVIADAAGVLRHCMRPDASSSASQVGLVTGYVQSGKTSNYTALCALARDNGYPLIIVITG